MHHLAIVQKSLSNVIHSKRLETLQQMVNSAFMAQSLTVTQLGRALPSTSEKNGIKKADRFLSNEKIHAEYPLISQRLISYLIPCNSSPWIIVDWSKMPHKDFHVLRASYAASGRSITLYEEVHEAKYLGSQKAHNQFVTTLHKLLPDSCNPIIITDAGFGVPWFKLILKQGWNYIGRVRGNKYYSKLPDIWLKCQGLKDIAVPSPKFIGAVKLTKKHLFKTNLYVIKHSSKGRHALNKAGNIRRDSTSKSKSKAATEPLVIVTSLKHKTTMPKKVIKIYQTRMTIEEGFRDLKSSKYGFGFEHTLSYKPKRILILLLIAMIASFIAYIIGMIAESKNIHYQFQANTIKHKRVLSLFYLGRRIIKKQIQQQLPLVLKHNFNKINYISFLKMI